MASDSREAVDDPIAYFVEEQRYHGRSERTQTAYERVLREFEAFLEGRGETPTSADRRDCMAYVHHLRETVEESTVATYASYLHRFYSYLGQVGVVDANPMALVLAEMDETIDKDPARREISVPEMRAFLADITHPLDCAVVCTFLKTGVRVGELCNLDLRDLQIEGVECFDVTPRVQLENRDASLYVPTEPTQGQEYNGEERTAANKRRRATIVPIDEELTGVMRRWLAIRPDTASPAEPLFCSTAGDWGQRLTTDAVRNIVRRHARRNGWYRQGGGPTENVTPHYFRHFFTTHLRDRTGDRGIVKYLRGDVAEDIIDTYTHNWGDRVRTVYESHIYTLL
jgi:site-specific recombinase XerD